MVAAAVLAVALLAGRGSHVRTLVPGAPLTGSIRQVDRVWTCDRPVDLDSLTVIIHARGARVGNRGANNNDAVHLRRGCTGRIRNIRIVQYRGDGIKVGRGVHDLVVDGGSIRCYRHDDGKHQDGIQAMGGRRVTFSNLDVRCTSANNAAFFVNRGRKNPDLPDGIVCERCFLDGGGITVRIYNSIRSGIRDSRVVTGRIRPLGIKKGAARDPVDAGNTILPAAPGARERALPAVPRVRVSSAFAAAPRVKRKAGFTVVSTSLRTDRDVLLSVAVAAGTGELLPLLRGGADPATTVVVPAAGSRRTRVTVRLAAGTLKQAAAYRLLVTARDARTGRQTTVSTPFTP